VEGINLVKCSVQKSCSMLDSESTYLSVRNEHSEDRAQLSTRWHEALGKDACSTDVEDCLKTLLNGIKRCADK
jgi:hypothetical protein